MTLMKMSKYPARGVEPLGVSLELIGLKALLHFSKCGSLAF